jgi:hypothetical protein
MFWALSPAASKMQPRACAAACFALTSFSLLPALLSMLLHSSEGSPQVTSDHSRGRGRGQIDNLEQFSLDVYLMRRRTIGVQGLNMACKIGCESQEVQVLLFGRQRVELLDVELGVRGVFPGGLLVRRRHW